MQDNNTNKSSNRQATDGFFIVNADIWERLFNVLDESYSDNDVIRTMATYLTICCGSGGDHKTSSWSGGAVYKYTGISPRVAKRSIKILSDNGFIAIDKAPVKNKLPVYKIKQFGIDTRSTDAKNIFVPNGVVKGVTGEDSPVKRLVNEQNKHLLYLFIRLYYFQDKYLDVISPNIVSSVLNTDDELQADAVHSFNNLLNAWFLGDEPAIVGYPRTEFYDFTIWKDDIDDPFICERTESGDFFGFFELLIGLGLVNEVFCAFNGDEVRYKGYTADSDEIVSQLDFIGTLDTRQQQELLGKLKAIATDSTKNSIDALSSYGKNIILPAKYKKVHFQRFYQLRYRTKLGESKIRYAQDRELTRDLQRLLAKIESSN